MDRQAEGVDGDGPQLMAWSRESGGEYVELAGESQPGPPVIDHHVRERGYRCRTTVVLDRVPLADI